MRVQHATFVCQYYEPSASKGDHARIIMQGLEGAISNLNVGGGVFQAAGRCNNWAIMMCAGYGNATLQVGYWSLPCSWQWVCSLHFYLPTEAPLPVCLQNYIAAQLGPALNYFKVMYENERE